MQELPGNLCDILIGSWNGSQFGEILKITENSTGRDIWGVLVKYLTDKKFQALLNNVSNLTSCWETGRTLTSGKELLPSYLVLLFAPPELLEHFRNNPLQTEAEPNASCSSHIWKTIIDLWKDEEFYNVLKCTCKNMLDNKCESWDPSVLILMHLFIETTPLDRDNFERTRTFDRIERILLIRDSLFRYADSMSIPYHTFKALSDDIKDVAKPLFGKNAEMRINAILNSEDHTEVEDQPEIENLNKEFKEQKVSNDGIVHWKSVMAQQFVSMYCFHTYYLSTSLSNCFLNILTLHPCSHGIEPIYVMYLCSLVLSIVPLSLLDCLVKIGQILGYSMNVGVIRLR